MQLASLCPAYLYKDKGCFSPSLAVVQLTYSIANEFLDLTDVLLLCIMDSLLYILNFGNGNGVIILSEP